MESNFTLSEDPLVVNYEVLVLEKEHVPLLAILFEDDFCLIPFNDVIFSVHLIQKVD